jgi:hypothetical protein
VVWGSLAASEARRIDPVPISGMPSADAIQGSAPTQIEGTAGGFGANYALAQLDDRAVVFGVNGMQLWSAVLDGREATSIHAIAATSAWNFRIGASAADELGQIGVCYTMGSSEETWPNSDEVLFVLVDRDGVPVTEPRVVSSALGQAGGCDVAWSGESFLVAWWQIEPEARDGASVVRAQRLTAPW